MDRLRPPPFTLSLKDQSAGSKAGAGSFQGLHEAFDNPALFEDVQLRRVFAYLIDLVLVGVLTAAAFAFGLLFGLLTFGIGWLLLPLLSFPLVAALYAMGTAGGSMSATLGMKMTGLVMRSWTGRKPSPLQALIHAILFYMTVPTTSGLVLVVGLLNERGRLLHDLLSGIVVVNAEPAPLIQGPEGS